MERYERYEIRDGNYEGKKKRVKQQIGKGQDT
jgi:hypothetical protein